MITFRLHQQLANDCHQLFSNNNFIMLLHKNALLPWFILVPKTVVNELHQLSEEKYLLFYKQIQKLSLFVEKEFKADKINIASIGNLVPQIHFHIIVRYKNDACWPQPIWGNLKNSESYDKNTIKNIGKKILQLF